MINRLRDAHTQYEGPKSLEDAVATLPFLVEAYGSDDDPQYVVSKVNRRLVKDVRFKPGVTLDWWNGVPFDRAVDLRIMRIRRKIEPDPTRPAVIRTIRGGGYLFSPAGDKA